MCGIAGYVRCSRPDFPHSPELINTLKKILYHRGPDSDGHWVSEKHDIAFIYRRLSIVDLSDAGSQPMFDQEKEICLMFNGEIYNHMSIRKELEARGYRYRSNSDTETIIYAYKEWGIKCIERLQGMFAIALYDLRTNELFLIRDRMGIKPLYFSLQSGMLSFASEIKALCAMPWIDRTINKHGLYHYLTYMVTPAPLTMYEGIYKLPAAYYAKIDAHRQITFHEWYTPLTSVSPELHATFADEGACVSTLRSLLKDSIKSHMMSDVPYGVFLSGGIDSSLNVALMAQCTDRVKTFNVAFDNDPNNEIEWARKVARHFATDHHEIVITEKDAFDFFNTMIYQQDEPLADCVNIPLYYVSQLLKKSGVTVVQIGEGSDELFCGYALYGRYLDAYRTYWQPTMRHLPGAIRRGLAALGTPFVSDSRADMLKNWAHNRSFFWSGAVSFAETSKQALVPAYHLQETTAADPIIEKIYPGFAQTCDSYAIVDYHLKKLQLLDPHADFFKTMTYLELKNRLPELLLMRADKMTMATSVEGRVPFLDHKVVEYALAMPTHYKYRNGTTKYILKKVCEGLLPEEVIYRKKVGFSAPIAAWFAYGSPFSEYLHDTIESTNTQLRDHLNLHEVRRLAAEHEQNTRNNSVQLWTILNVLTWMNQLEHSNAA